MAKKQGKVLYVCPRNEHTNHYIARRLDQDDHGQDRLKCADARPRSLWEVDEELLRRLESDKASLELKYDVFISEDGGRPRLCSTDNLFTEILRSA